MLKREGRTPDDEGHARWLEQLALLLRAGIPLQSALPLLMQLQQAGEQAYWQPVWTAVARGHALSTGLGTLRGFTATDLALLAGGEDSGQLEPQLQRLAGRRRRQLEVRRRILRAVRYPAGMLAGALLIGGFLLLQVVPQFATLYAQFGATLPLLTRGVLALSTGVQTHWPWLLPALVLPPTAALLAWRHRPSWRCRVLGLLWRLPLAKRPTRLYWLALWHRALADLLAAALPLPDALARCARLVAPSPLGTGQQALQASVLGGHRLAQAVDAAPGYPDLSAQMISLGEESGMLVAMLETLASQYEQALDTSCDSLLALLEPLLMALLGLLVGTLVMALYLPLFQLGQVMR